MANKVIIDWTDRDFGKNLSKDDRVQRALREHAKKVARTAKALLAPHRDTGAHKVEYVGHASIHEYGHIDHYVELTGPAPISVEFGHRTENGRWVHGLYIMTRALSTR
jgi:hypothetical protein